MSNYKAQISNQAQNPKSKKFFKFGIWILFVIWILLFGFSAKAATNIVPDSPGPPPVYNQWAWNDIIGWIDFYGTNTVNVKGDKIEGYANNNAIGYISLDCATGPTGSDCIVPYNVVNDVGGNLSGWAWNENIGWISFSYLTGGGLVPYGVTITPATGEFNGWAWNDVVGWISFNCANTTTCDNGVNYRVKTLAGSSSIKGNLESSIFDAGSVDGAMLNSIMWRGAQPNGTVVKFKIASSDNLVGPWDASSYWGPDGTIISFYQPIGPDISQAIKGHTNKRYFRYKIFLETDNWQTYSPRVDDVIINYSP